MDGGVPLSLVCSVCPFDEAEFDDARLKQLERQRPGWAALAFADAVVFRNGMQEALAYAERVVNGILFRQCHHRFLRSEHRYLINPPLLCIDLKHHLDAAEERMAETYLVGHNPLKYLKRETLRFWKADPALEAATRELAPPRLRRTRRAGVRAWCVWF